MQNVKFRAFYLPLNSQGHIAAGPQHYHLWKTNPHISDNLCLDTKPANPLGHWGPLLPNTRMYYIIPSFNCFCSTCIGFFTESKPSQKLHGISGGYKTYILRLLY